MVLVGKIDQNHLNYLIERTEQYIKRKVRSLVLNQQEYEKLLPELRKRPRVLVWQANREESK
jgi:hypothetical protein